MCDCASLSTSPNELMSKLSQNLVRAEVCVERKGGPATLLKMAQPGPPGPKHSRSETSVVSLDAFSVIELVGAEPDSIDLW